MLFVASCSLADGSSAQSQQDQLFQSFLLHRFVVFIRGSVGGLSEGRWSRTSYQKATDAAALWNNITDLHQVRSLRYG